MSTPTAIPENKYKWKPVRNTVIKSNDLATEIHENGFAVLSLLDAETLAELRAIYESEHSLNPENGGMFYSLYSQDEEYRFRVHKKIGALLEPVLASHFQEYKNVVNSFVVKAPGKESEFYVHQDTTALDEFQFSPLSLWIPLHEINESNGAMTLIEKTHWLFSPYRGVSFNFPFKNIVSTVRNYLKPVYMKPGEVLLFDPRVVHNSMENQSEKERVAIICGVFHKDARFETCFKDPNNTNSPIEIYRHDDDYTLKYPNFFYNCHERPVSGEKFKEVPDLFEQMDAETFENYCRENNIPEQNQLGPESDVSCNMIAEPDGINRSSTVQEPVTTSERPAEKPKGFFRFLKRQS